ncbi:MAG: thioredoxin domain-containing protein, partial [Ignavibacteriales bacterium]
CHWCHVMERESFEDQEVAEIMNRDFVAIKVDREERPDIDHIYMTYCQAVTGEGGWPLTVFLTPDKKPFYAGTYYPKHSKWGRPGVIELLDGVREAWDKTRDKLLTQADKTILALGQRNQTTEQGEITRTVLDNAYVEFEHSFDSKYGGFGRAPKFPTPHSLFFLTRYGRLAGQKTALKMVDKTLQAMYRGGIYDHIGGGFARYSTDEKWLVPHFEKMLYDNALLALAYLDGYQVLDEPIYRTVAEEIFQYVLRDMTSPEGGFYSAEDADSEGVEGKFYVWTPDEVKQILGSGGDDFCHLFDITERGNFEEQNIPNLIKTSLDEVENKRSAVDAAREKLRVERDKRIHPYKDDKILTSWNGLMIAALARGYKVLGVEDYRDAARKAVDFIFAKLRREDGRLLARFRDGEAAYPAYADDYTFLIWGLIELYEATFEPRYINDALDLHRDLIKLFWDDQNGGLFFYGSDGEEQILRPKEFYDGATPSANSVFAYNLGHLAKITGDKAMENLLDKQLAAVAGEVEHYPRGYSFMLTAALMRVFPGREIVIVGNLANQATEAMVDVINTRFLPNTVAVHHPAEAHQFSSFNQHLEDYVQVDNKPTAYVCQNFACQAPITSVEDLKDLIDELS